MSRPDLSDYSFEEKPSLTKAPSLRYPLIAAGAVLAWRLFRYSRLTNIHLKETYLQRTRILVQGTVVYGIIISMLNPEVWQSFQKKNEHNREVREAYLLKHKEERERKAALENATTS